MLFRLVADFILIIHLSFILFVIFGAYFLTRWSWLIVLHLPAVAWGVFIEVSAGICPLTYLENYLRLKAGEKGYSESFIEHYLLPIIYPHALTPTIQLVLAGLLLGINLVFYARFLYQLYIKK